MTWLMRAEDNPVEPFLRGTFARFARKASSSDLEMLSSGLSPNTGRICLSNDVRKVILYECFQRGSFSANQVSAKSAKVGVDEQGATVLVSMLRNRSTLFEFGK